MSMLSTQSILFSSILAGLCLVTTWLVLSFSSPQPGVVLPTAGQPDAILRQVNSYIFDKQGRLQFNISTPYLSHLAQQDTTQLRVPIFTFYRPARTPWRLTAQLATGQAGLQDILLQHQVHLTHTADAKNPETILETNQLTLHPYQKTAETPALVTLTQPGLSMRSIGMRANLNTGDIMLLSNAAGTYLPPH